MNKEILIIVPTMTRPSDFTIFMDSWMATTEGRSDVIAAINHDDDSYNGFELRYPFMIRRVEKGAYMPMVNALAAEYCYEYKYLAFLEDDCQFVTHGWETAFITALEEIGDYGVVYGEDCVNHERLIGIPFMSSKIVQVLGYMSPPELKYLYVDNFWKTLSTRLRTCRYMPEIIVEHRHYSRGKRKKDDISFMVDAQMPTEGEAYAKYMRERFESDLDKLNKAKE